MIGRPAAVPFSEPTFFEGLSNEATARQRQWEQCCSHLQGVRARHGDRAHERSIASLCRYTGLVSNIICADLEGTGRSSLYALALSHKYRRRADLGRDSSGRVQEGGCAARAGRHSSAPTCDEDLQRCVIYDLGAQEALQRARLKCLQYLQIRSRQGSLIAWRLSWTAKIPTWCACLFVALKYCPGCLPASWHSVCVSGVHGSKLLSLSCDFAGGEAAGVGLLGNSGIEEPCDGGEGFEDPRAGYGRHCSAVLAFLWMHIECCICFVSSLNPKQPYCRLSIANWLVGP